MITHKKKRLFKWHFFQVRIKNPSEKYPESERWNYIFKES
jgi:hypothetical protein